jgi:hypothetical protein
VGARDDGGARWRLPRCPEPGRRERAVAP